MRRVYDLSSTSGSHILKLPKSRGLIFNFQFGKDASRPGRPGDFRVPISAAQRMGWNLTGGYLGTAVDEIMKIGGRKTESVVKYYIGATFSEKVHGSKRKRGQRATLALASYHCRLSFKKISQRVCERNDQMLRKFE